MYRIRSLYDIVSSPNGCDSSVAIAVGELAILENGITDTA